jgi:alkaline phosphatase D
MKIIHFLFLFVLSVNSYSNQEILTLGFGSCLHQDRSMAILKTIEKKELDLFMFIGDNVYGDQEDGELDKLIRTYKQQYNNLENFLKNVSTEFIWDDHDFGINDGGSNYRYKDRAKELFLETWKIPSNDPRRFRDGLYFDKMIKKNGLKVHLIFLDNRSFKSEWKLTDEFNKEGKERYVKDFDPQKTLLGKKQWQWLKDKLNEDSDIKIILSSLQILSLGHGWESWDKLPLERERLFNLIDESDVSNLFILSGDRHRGGFYRFKTNGDNDIHEFTSSSLNLPIPFNTEEKGPLRIGSTYRKANFGVVRIFEDKVVMELTSNKGKVVNSLSVEIN